MSHLNEAQEQAVLTDAPRILVLAGAGSGKTRVLAHRVAHVIQEQGISPHAVLAVTFTNKAAREMTNRIESLLGMPARGMWIGTFHGLAHRLLRTHHNEAGLLESFQILDSEDQKRVIKRIMKAGNISEDRWPVRQVQSFISSQKQAGRRARHIVDNGDLYSQVMIRIYNEYEEACDNSGLVDFSELLLRVHELFRENPEILEYYQTRFAHILVDEFQDTNAIQYKWLSQLLHENNSMMIVGDDDQSIYGWRGADVTNLQRFRNDNPNTELVRLQRNYRSTPNILNAANALIENNQNRMGKSLYSELEQGPLISRYSAFNETDEARYILSQIQEWVSFGYPKNEIAILYRANAQSRILEEVLSHAGMPYRVYGGLRFFERAEIKDALSYLRLAINPNDDASFERVINTPARGIGQTTVGKLRDIARERQSSLWQAGQIAVEEKLFSARAVSSLSMFFQLISDLSEQAAKDELPELVHATLMQSGLWDHYSQDKSEKGQAKLENLEELISATRQYIIENENGLVREDEIRGKSERESGVYSGIHEHFERSFNKEDHFSRETMQPLVEFLANAALEAGEKQSDQNEEGVQLMTLHSAKGLEFSVVFLTGLEEGLFPIHRAIDDSDSLEEERRLCYVGMTRAKYKLYLTHAEIRRMRGRETYQRPSRFINEIPMDTIEDVRSGMTVQRPQTAAATPKYKRDFRSTKILNSALEVDGYKLGDRVRHAKFGEGTVLNYEGKGGSLRLQVRFKAGVKWLAAKYANLEKI